MDKETESQKKSGMGQRIVVALGGNALGNTPKEQMAKTEIAAASIADLVCDGYDVIVSHGNGPQVGMIALAFSESSKNNGNIPEMPLPESCAMSQGYIGYHLQSAISRELQKRGMEKNAVALITRVEVDPDDVAFSEPTKPIGAFYSENEMREIKKQDPTQDFVEDSGRGYRRVVPSPTPKGIIEIREIRELSDMGNIVIACGGGGVPVIRRGAGDYRGVDAVIDKDLASARLAEEVGADTLIILTAVDKVALNFGKENEKLLSHMTVDEARGYIKEGHFAKGSMLPKINASIMFAESKKGRRALIARLENVADAVGGKSGTVIEL